MLKKKLIFALVTAGAALGMAATAYGQPERQSAHHPSAADHARINTAMLPPQVGNEKWVVLLCRFADSPTPVPHLMADYNSAFNTHPKSHKNYFKEASYGQLNLSFTVKDWRPIPARSTFTSFAADGEQFLLKLYDACTKTHDATTNFADFNGIAMFFDDREKDVSDGTACQFGDTCTNNRTLGITGYGYVNLQTKVLDGKKGFRAIWMKTTFSNEVPALNEATAHEMHHAYGAPHSAAGTDDPNDAECVFNNQDSCGHPWDLMASAWTGLPTDTHTLAATKVFHHKWINAAPRRCNVLTDVTDKVFELDRPAKPLTNTRCLAITIKFISGSDPAGTTAYWYVVEARFPIGFDGDSSPSFAGGGVPGPAVIISRLCIGTHPVCDPRPIVLGRDLDNNFDIDENSAEWQPGETFTNYDGRIKVQVVSKGAGFYTVKVTRNMTP